MKNKTIKKFTIFIIVFGLFVNFVYADDFADIKDSVTKTIQTLIQKYEDQIKVLQDENTKLKQDIENLTRKLQGSNIKDPTSTSASTNTVLTGSIKASDNPKYNDIIQRINDMSKHIFKDNNLSENCTIGLFEFIEPNNFFISIDDGKNPDGVTAFKIKILYSYDANYTFTVKGVFSLDTRMSLYVTKFGSNPFAGVKRIRVKNPEYKGKLLEEVNTSTTSNSNTTVSSPSAVVIPATSLTTSMTGSINVTLNDIKQAYNKNKILDVLKLSNEYIKTDPNNIEVLKMRYRSFYILGKYIESISEIQKIEAIQGNDIEKIVVCDASVIAKIAKDTELSAKYKAICNKK